VHRLVQFQVNLTRSSELKLSFRPGSRESAGATAAAPEPAGTVQPRAAAYYSRMPVIMMPVIIPGAVTDRDGPAPSPLRATVTVLSEFQVQVTVLLQPTQVQIQRRPAAWPRPAVGSLPQGRRIARAPRRPASPCASLGLPVSGSCQWPGPGPRALSSVV
jgi:hypothetical protein